MKKNRRLMLSFLVLFALMFCFGTSLQAAGVEEQVELKGPDVIPDTCAGAVVGRASIEHKDLDLAQQIVGSVLDKDKSDDSIDITLRFRNGPPNALFNVIWAALSIPGDCASIISGTFVGQISTDANGAGRDRYRLQAGNPFPGNGVKLLVCLPTGPTGNCVSGDTVYTALFTEVFPPAP